MASRDDKAAVLERVRKMVDDLDETGWRRSMMSEKEAEEETRFESNQTRVFDDGTNTFFWRAHSITVLFGMLCALLYVALLEDVSWSTEYNTKRGVGMCIMVFCLFGMTQAKDGPFQRPHPAIWRFILCLSVIYELFLVFMLFQSVEDARKIIAALDPELGKELPEKTYAEECSFYTPEHPDGSFHNFWEKWDIFVFAHMAGWYVKMLMIRDYWMCNILSFLFEIMEYTLEHQLNNFGECWWDHWIMDFIVCNGIGIWLGMKTLDYLNMKTYSWRGLYNIPSYSGKLKRMILQFTPYSWTKFEWRPTENLSRWLAILGICAVWTTAELNTFYLKTLLWIPPPHLINWARMILLVPIGTVAMRETYQYLEDSSCKKFGQQSWILCAIIFTEVLISIKFQYEVITRPIPQPYAAAWSLFLIGLAIYTVWRFCIWSPHTWHHHGNEDAEHEKVTRTVETHRVLNSVTKHDSATSRTTVDSGGDGSVPFNNVNSGKSGSSNGVVGGDGRENGTRQTRSRYATRSKNKNINGK